MLMNSDDDLTPEKSSLENDPHASGEGYEVVDDTGDVLQQVQDTRDEVHEAAQVTSVAETETNSETDADRAAEIDDDDPSLVVLAEPFVGQWNTLISTTNWEKGRIIADWRQALKDEGAPSTHYSDEAWVRRVGGVTSPHVGRLRRVFEKFGETHETYPGVFWSHFLAALDWEDAPLWLEGAAQESWSVSQMREQRWQANGAVESQRPTASQVIEVDLDEDVVLPAQGGGSDRKYDDDADGINVGPIPEGPDFGDEPDYGNGEELASMNGGRGGARRVSWLKKTTTELRCSPLSACRSCPRICRIRLNR